MPRAVGWGQHSPWLAPAQRVCRDDEFGPCCGAHAEAAAAGQRDETGRLDLVRVRVRVRIRVRVRVRVRVLE